MYAIYDWSPTGGRDADERIWATGATPREALDEAVLLFGDLGLAMDRVPATAEELGVLCRAGRLLGTDAWDHTILRITPRAHAARSDPDGPASVIVLRDGEPVLARPDEAAGDEPVRKG